MFGLTALELARIQFGFTVSFHIVFPAITIGLASYLEPTPKNDRRFAMGHHSQEWPHNEVHALLLPTKGPP
jgi:hypothetical protein